MLLFEQLLNKTEIIITCEYSGVIMQARDAGVIYLIKTDIIALVVMLTLSLTCVCAKILP